MADDLPLPDHLEIKHGDAIGQVGPDAKQYYQPQEDAEIKNETHMQKFGYQFTLGDHDTTAITLTIAHDTKNDEYHIFTHDAGISPEFGLGNCCGFRQI